MLESLFNWRKALRAAGFALALAASPASVFATQNAGPEKKPVGAAPDAAAKPAGKPWSLRVSKGAPFTFTVKAREARLNEITDELGRVLKVPVTLSPLLARQKVTLDFGGLNLEATLRMLAPQSYVDYVAGGGGDEPKPLALYLQGANERPPSNTAAVRGTSEAILIEGDTEEGTDGEAQKKREEENPLRVSWSNNQLSVRARKQPLTVVLFKIASEVGVPFEMRYESAELVDVDFQNYPLEQAFRSLSPGVRFYYRVDLQTFQVQPLRLALLAPTAARS